MKGISKHGKRWRLRKYNCHIGVYDTYEEAVIAGQLEDKEQLKFKYMQQYLSAKKWLQANGVLPQ